MLSAFNPLVPLSLAFFGVEAASLLPLDLPSANFCTGDGDTGGGVTWKQLALTDYQKSSQKS